MTMTLSQAIEALTNEQTELARVIDALMSFQAISDEQKRDCLALARRAVEERWPSERAEAELESLKKRWPEWRTDDGKTTA